MKLIDRYRLWRVKKAIKHARRRHTDKCHSFAYQQIERNGVVILPGARDVVPRFELFRLPDDLRGYRILDIGCNLGAMSMEFKRRGASLVVGIDADPNMIRCARTLADICGIGVAYYAVPLENLETIPQLRHASFDIVVLTSVWRHVKNREAALAVLDRHVADMLIFEEMDDGDIEEIEKALRPDQVINLGTSERLGRRVFALRRRSVENLDVNGRLYRIIEQWRVPWHLSSRPEHPGRVYYKLERNGSTFYAKRVPQDPQGAMNRLRVEFEFLQAHQSRFPDLLCSVEDMEIGSNEAIWVGDFFAGTDLETYIRTRPAPAPHILQAWQDQISAIFCAFLAEGVTFGHIACRNVLIAQDDARRLRLCDFEGIGLRSHSQNIQSIVALLMSIRVWRPQEGHNSYDPSVPKLFRGREGEMATSLQRELEEKARLPTDYGT